VSPLDDMRDVGPRKRGASEPEGARNGSEEGRGEAGPHHAGYT
jgi:hypothetical protein